MSGERIRVRTWRGVFRTPWRVPGVMGIDFTRVTPGGPTARACMFAFVGLFAAWILGQVHVTLGFPSLGRYVVLFAFAAWLGGMDMPDGRGVLSHARSAARSYGLAAVGAFDPPDGGEWHDPPGPVPVMWDGSCDRVRSGRITGPALIRFEQPVRLKKRRRTIEAHASSTGSTGPIVLTPGQKLTVHA